MESCSLSLFENGNLVVRNSKSKYELAYDSRFPFVEEQEFLQLEEESNLMQELKDKEDSLLQFFVRCSKGAGLMEIYLSPSLFMSIPLRIGDYGRRHLCIVTPS
jgi:hypothetical protein